MNELTTLLAKKIEERSKINMEIFSIQEAMRILKEDNEKPNPLRDREH